MMYRDSFNAHMSAMALHWAPPTPLSKLPSGPMAASRRSLRGYHAWSGGVLDNGLSLSSRGADKVDVFSGRAV